MKKKSIKKNMVMSFLLTSSNIIFPAISFSYVARILTPSGTGKVAFVFSIITYFSYLAILGIPSYGLREAAKLRNDKDKLSHLVQELVIINLVSTLIAYLLLTATVLMIPRLYEDRKLFLVMGGYILLNSIGLEWLYQALEEYTYITIRSLICRTIALALTFVLIRTKEDVIWYGFIIIFTRCASYVFNILHIRKYIDFTKHNKYRYTNHIKPILTLFVASVIITIYANFDITMIGFISSENEVGLYNSALKIKTLILSLSTSVTGVLVPRTAYYLKNGIDKEVNSLIEKSMRVSLCLAIPVAVYVFFFGGDCLGLLCGLEYLGALPTLRVLSVCIVPLVLTNIFGNQILILIGDEKRYSISVFVGLCINIILNAMLIPSMGSLGAAIGTLATECWNVFWMSNGVKTYRSMLAKTIGFYKYLFPLVVCSCVSVIILKYIHTSIIYRILLSGTIFFGIYYGILLLEKEPLLYGQVSNIVGRFSSKHK